MRSRSRNDDEKLQRRNSILKAARKIILSKGYEKTTMDDIARAAQLSRGLLYVYFKDKDDIQMGLSVIAGETLFQRMQQAVATTGTGIEAINALGEAYYQFYLQDHDHFQCLCMRMGMVNPKPANQENPTSTLLEMMAVEDKLMALMSSAVEQGLEDGTIDPDKVESPLQTAMFLRGSLHGVIMLQDSAGSSLFDRTALDREELIRYAMRIASDELRAKPRRSTMPE
ncbi:MULTISPECIES: TetR/AcrR family transcriptional regulator [unclassified Ketobacter]|uniref:TetR/AcrR family transcriptional regulator n=1 Tax=unclassified Ketobacter TaxID=2639109 RepID=UPI000F2AE00F|nr:MULTISPECIES: TetR/AcrR family transcriptional regulator [unclassified Ketobacter]RLT90461.1 MAG: TetR family transcriptional regulator [Ketobacter sp. GenoA1]RLT99558.1 MAG: TetR family transcriptional regulator [Ketobacter sp.]